MLGGPDRKRRGRLFWREGFNIGLAPLGGFFKNYGYWVGYELESGPVLSWSFKR